MPGEHRVKRRLVKRPPRKLTDASSSEPERPTNPREDRGVAPHQLEHPPHAEGERNPED